MSHRCPILALAMFASILAPSCASRQHTQSTTRTSYDKILATNDSALHPRIVRLLRYTGDYADEPHEFPPVPGFVFAVLAPESERGTKLWRHYCWQPGGHVDVAQPGKTYLMTMDGPARFGWAHAYTNEPSCGDAYRFMQIQ